MAGKSFDNYVVFIYGGTEGRVGQLICYNGKSFAGRIDFYADGASLPEDYFYSFQHPGGSIDEYVGVHMPMSRFDPVMSTVRQEKPLVLGILPFQPFSGYLGTSEMEPVGEEEGIA